MGDMADWTIDQGIMSDIEEPWLAEEQDAEERRLAKRKRAKTRADRKKTQKPKPTH